MYSVVDIETTGNGFKGQKITEISIFIFDGEKIIDEFTSLVNPEQKIPHFITNLTGITEAMVRTAPKFYEIAKKVAEITKDTIFVAHNVNFDYNIIRDEFKSLGFDFKLKKLCTVRLSRKIIPGLASYSLGNICSAEGIKISARHRAKGDAEATVEMFRRLLKRDDAFTINSFLNVKSREATLPPLLDKQVVDTLPERHGVYYFKNQQKEVIYVGKANNIKQRVISHFYDKKKKERKMCLEIADISYTETGNELIALLHESSEIKHLYPKFNRAQRKAGEAVGLFSYEEQKGIPVAGDRDVAARSSTVAPDECDLPCSRRTGRFRTDGRRQGQGCPRHSRPRAAPPHLQPGAVEQLFPDTARRHRRPAVQSSMERHCPTG